MNEYELELLSQLLSQSSAVDTFTDEFDNHKTCHEECSAESVVECVSLLLLGHGVHSVTYKNINSYIAHFK